MTFKLIMTRRGCVSLFCAPRFHETVHGAEGVLSDAREAARRASDQLSLAKLAVRERSGGGTGLRCAHHDTITACGRSVLRLGWSLRFCVTLDSVPENGGVLCRVRDLDDVLFKDVGGKIRHDGRSGRRVSST